MRVPSCTAALLAASASVLAAPSADPWMGARPSLQLAVSRTDMPDRYTVRAKVWDLRSGAVLSEPILVVEGGKPAVAEVGALGTPGAMLVAFTVTVDADGRRAACSSEVRDNGTVISAQRATLAVEP